MPREYVRELVVQELTKTNVEELALKSDVLSKSIEDIVEGKNTTRLGTLLKVVTGIQGWEGRIQFIERFKDHSHFFKTAYLVIKDLHLHSSKKNAVPSQIDLVNPIIYEVLAHTGSDTGISKELLLKKLPHRKEVISQLVDRQIIYEKDGRLYSDFLIDDPMFMFEVIRNKINLLKNVSRDRSLVFNVFGAEETFTLKGAIDVLSAITNLTEVWLNAIERESCPDGIVMSLNAFANSYGINESVSNKINEIWYGSLKREGK